MAWDIVKVWEIKRNRVMGLIWTQLSFIKKLYSCNLTLKMGNLNVYKLCSIFHLYDKRIRGEYEELLWIELIKHNYEI